MKQIWETISVQILYLYNFWCEQTLNKRWNSTDYYWAIKITVLWSSITFGKFWEKQAALGNTLTSPRRFCIKALLFNFYFLNNNNKKIVHLGKLSCHHLTFQNTKLKKIPIKKKTGLQPSVQLLIAVVVTQVP